MSRVRSGTISLHFISFELTLTLTLAGVLGRRAKSTLLSTPTAE
jgi:hypothetical protein